MVMSILSSWRETVYKSYLHATLLVVKNHQPSKYDCYCFCRPCILSLSAISGDVLRDARWKPPCISYELSAKAFLSPPNRPMRPTRSEFRVSTDDRERSSIVRVVKFCIRVGEDLAVGVLL